MELQIPVLLGVGGVVAYVAVKFLIRFAERMAERLADEVDPKGIAKAAKGLFTWVKDKAPKLRLIALVTTAAIALVAAGVAIGMLADEGDSEGPGEGGATTSTISADAVEVMVVLEGSQLSNFREVVREYEESFGVPVEVTSVGTAIGAELDERFADGNPPDVAMIPQPALVRRLAREGRLQPIRQEVVDRLPEEWQAFTRATSSPESDAVDEYGVFVEGAHKSLFWYQADSLAQQQPEHWTLTDMTEWFQDELQTQTFEAPLTMAVGDDWPLTDWFENELAALAPDLYNDLANGCTIVWDHPEVRLALSDMARIWGTDGVLLDDDHPDDDVLANHKLDELAHQVGDGEAGLMFAPSFVAGWVESLDVADQPRPFGFPEIEGTRPLMVGGDIAVVPQQSDRGQDFVDWLTDEEALERWIEVDRGFLTPNDLSPHVRGTQPSSDPAEDVRVLLTWMLRNPSGELFYDLSDQFGVVDEGDATVTWDVFTEFFGAVTTGSSSDTDAIDDAIEQLERAAQSADAPWGNCDD